MSEAPTLYARILTSALKNNQGLVFSVMSVLRDVNTDNHGAVGIMQVKKTLDRMCRNGLLERKALGRFQWKE